MFTLFFSIIILSLILLPSSSVAFNFKSFLALNSAPSKISKSIPLIEDLFILIDVFWDILGDTLLLLLLLLELLLELEFSDSVENPPFRVCLEISLSSTASVFIVPFVIFLSFEFKFFKSSYTFSIVFFLLSKYLLFNI